MVQGCHNCKKRPSAQTCAKCRRIDYDDINIAKEPHVSEIAAANLASAPSEPALRVSRLPPSAETKLLELFATVSALDPLDALLLLHVAKGGRLADFGAELNRIAEAAGRYGAAMSRATAHARWENLAQRFKPFAALAHWRNAAIRKNKES